MAAYVAMSHINARTTVMEVNRATGIKIGMTIPQPDQGHDKLTDENRAANYGAPEEDGVHRRDPTLDVKVLPDVN